VSRALAALLLLMAACSSHVSGSDASGPFDALTPDLGGAIDATPFVDATEAFDAAPDAAAQDGAFADAEAGTTDTGTSAIDGSVADAGPSDAEPGDTGLAPVVSISVQSSGPTIGVGARVLFTVTASLADHSMVVESPASVSWSFAPTGVLVAEATGGLRAVSAGSVRATASVGGASASTSLIVAPSSTHVWAQAATLVVSPQLKSHAWGQTRPLVVRPPAKFHSWGQANVTASRP
jgi:hypothetical protein